MEYCCIQWTIKACKKNPLPIEVKTLSQLKKLMQALKQPSTAKNTTTAQKNKKSVRKIITMRNHQTYK
jgi:hypothetical protein